MPLHAAEPQYLWLLLLLPVVWYAAKRLRSIEPGRRWTIIILRTLIVVLLVFALAKVEFVRRARDMTVYFLLDQSDSIPPEIQQRSTAIIGDLLRDKPRDDEAGLIVFGGNASLETVALPTFEFDGRLSSIVEGVRTDISSAMRLALSAFPNDRMRRIVVLTDGNENVGSAVEVARLALNSNTPVDIVPLTYEQRADVQIDKVIVPQTTAKDTPFDVKVYLSATEATTGRLTIYRDDVVVAQESVDLTPGRNAPLILPQRLDEGGFHRYRAEIEVSGDTRPQNNTGQAFTNLKSEPRVLYVEGDPANMTDNLLAGALLLEDIQVALASPDNIPYNIDELQSFDSIILSNIHANEMTFEQMTMLERAVHDLGIGLIMIGGEDSFGAGGYQDSPIEKALPVDMDVKQKKVLPNGALAIVLHTVEIPQGNAWAREISIAALNVLSAQDYFGLLYYGAKQGVGPGGGGGGWGEYWLWDPGMQQTGNKRQMRAMIRGVQPMDMPTFDPTLELAYEGLKDLTTQAKHIVVISDGDPAPPNERLVKQIRDEGITVSAIAIAPHHGQTVQTLRDMAYWGAGNFYFPKTARELPRIFVKEASVVRRSLIFEEPFFPKFDTFSETLEGISEMPQLEGYVVTSDKPLATIPLRTDKDDPLLAHWRYGLGKTVAWTSDAKNKWAGNWTTWEGYAKFWSQVVRWSLRETSSQNLQVNTEIRGGKGFVTIDAVDEDGNFINYLDFESVILDPDLEQQEIDVQQVGPGRYEGTFEAGEVGTYMARLSATEEGQEDETPQTVIAGASVSYSPEYTANRTNIEFLERIARESGGVVADNDYNPFEKTMPPTERPKPIWEWLLLAGILLIPVDVFVRRVYLDPKEMMAAVLSPFRRTSPEEHEKRMGSLMAAKKRVHTEREQKQEEETRRREFRERLQKEGPEREGSVFDEAKQSGGKAPARRSGKQTVSPEEGSGSAGGLSGLKEAKERARKKMK